MGISVNSPGAIDEFHPELLAVRGDEMSEMSHEDLDKTLKAKHQVLPLKASPGGWSWQKIVLLSLMIFSGIIASYFFSEELITVSNSINWTPFLIMLGVGFLAQLTDGSLGMGYGTISTTFLLAYGVSPALVSSQVHSARVFTSGVSGYSHHRFGNINKKLYKTLLVPGIIGAVSGATLAYFGQEYAKYLRLPLAMYTLYLGYFIIKKAFKKKKNSEKVTRAGWLAAAGGFMDAFAGGGWGTLVTSSLMSKRKNPRYVIGTVCLVEFFVVFSSALTFFILLRHIPVFEILGLIVGGLIAAPIAVRLVGKLPLKTMFVLVGLLVICTSLSTFYKAILQIF